MGYDRVVAGFIGILATESNAGRSRLVRSLYVACIGVMCLGMAGCVGGCGMKADLERSRLR